jgi:hypothetical protein
VRARKGGITYREAERIFGSIRNLEAVKAELMETHQTTRGPDLRRVIDDIGEVRVHLRVINLTRRRATFLARKLSRRPTKFAVSIPEEGTRSMKNQGDLGENQPLEDL